MLSSLMRGLRLALCAGLLLAPPLLAQDTFVVVPDHPQGIPVNGCFRATQNLFGPYRLTFCLERRGTYQVRGGGLMCDGRLFWHTAGRDIFIDLERASCGRGRAWEEASIDCRHSGNLLTQGLGRAAGIPLLNSLRCTYHPSVPNVSRRNFTAVRI